LFDIIAIMEIVVVLLVIVGVLLAANLWVWRVSRSRPLPPSPTEGSLLRRVIDVIPDYIFVLDNEGRFTISNRTHYTHLGAASMEEIIGKKQRDFFSKERADAYEQEDEVIRRTQQTLRMEIPSDAKSDDVRWLQITRMPLVDSNKQVEGIVSVIRDITDAKTVETRLQERISQFNLLSHVDTEISSTLNMGRVTMFALDMLMRLSVADAGYIAVLDETGDNLNVVAVLGKYLYTHVGTQLNPNEGVVGRVIREQKAEFMADATQDPDYVPQIAATKALMLVPLLAQDRLVGLIRLETSNPERFTSSAYEFTQLVAARIALAVDNARLYALVEQKLSETEKLFKQTNALYEEVKSLEQVKTDMIRIASHDLKNPLAVIEGYLMILGLEAEQYDAATNDMIGEMSRAAQRMSKILQDILSLEKIAERAKGEYKPVFLEQIVQNAYEEFLRQAEGKHQSLALQLDAETTFEIKGDADQLHEAIANLISNAIKYTPEKGNVTLSLEKTAEKIIFKVVDSGYGIPEEYQERLFQPFYRARTDETLTIEGTGLGLHLVKNIIERHHGTMIFNSVYGKGSTFGFEIPLRLFQKQTIQLIM
jgi:PAS domain S-box-containing protein